MGWGSFVQIKPFKAQSETDSKKREYMFYKKNEETNKWTHREIYEMNISKIPTGYHVHHIDKNSTNNNLSNLIAIPEEFHIELHELDRKGFILKTKREVEIALAYYLRGKFKNTIKVNPIKKVQNKRQNKTKKRIHSTSLYRNSSY